MTRVTSKQARSKSKCTLASLQHHTAASTLCCTRSNANQTSCCHKQKSPDTVSTRQDSYLYRMRTSYQTPGASPLALWLSRQHQGVAYLSARTPALPGSTL